MRQPKSGAKFINRPDDQQAMPGADEGYSPARLHFFLNALSYMSIRLQFRFMPAQLR
ncbi:MAG: hypothetical protein AAFO04_09395 [Cyanobacteria bacterium J06592_8]